MLIDLFKSILGNSGATAMERLLKTEIAPYLVPRVIVGWLRNESVGVIDIPVGCPLYSLSKTLNGYTGFSKFGELDYNFNDADEKHVAAVIAVSLNQNISTSIPRDIDLAKLAKTIDALIKIQKKPDNLTHDTTTIAEPIEPNQPIPAQPVNPPQVQHRRTIPKIPRTSLKLSESASNKDCKICGEKSFTNNKYTGCYCFKSLAKNVKTSKDSNGYKLILGDAWDDEAVLTLMELFNG
jgi:hypothetical protein